MYVLSLALPQSKSNFQILLCNKQFSFCSKLSTTAALSNFADEVLLNMEQGNLCGAVFLDLAKAFNTVDHKILMSKLSAVGVSPSTLEWFGSYLNNRKQRTSCGNVLSGKSKVTLYADDMVLYCFSKDIR